LARYPIPKRSEIVAEMDLPGRLNAGEHAHHDDTLVEGFSRGEA
jgi:hypothetical protein